MELREEKPFSVAKPINTMQDGEPIKRGRGQHGWSMEEKEEMLTMFGFLFVIVDILVTRYKIHRMLREQGHG